jgi:hypothetical protein
MSSMLGIAPAALTFGEDREMKERRPFELRGVFGKQFA